MDSVSVPDLQELERERERRKKLEDLVSSLRQEVERLKEVRMGRAYVITRPKLPTRGLEAGASAYITLLRGD